MQPCTALLYRETTHLCKHGFAGAGGSIQEDPLDLLDQLALVEFGPLQWQYHPVPLRQDTYGFSFTPQTP